MINQMCIARECPSLMGRDQLYTGRAGKSSREKPFNKILSLRSQYVPRGLVVTKRLVFLKLVIVVLFFFFI